MKNVVAITVLATILGGCATATLVESEPGKRVVVTVSPKDDPEARAKGLALAQGECNGKKAVKVKEGRVVTGSETTGNSQETPETHKSYNLFNGKSSYVTSKNTQQSSSTRNTYEWQIVYECQ